MKQSEPKQKEVSKPMSAKQRSLKNAPDASMDRRPGVPMEASVPHKLPGAHWAKPEQQDQTSVVFKRVGLEQMTPVFGSCQPPRGLSGRMRGYAYRIPETRATRWMILLMSDRVDAMEGRLIDAFTRKPFAGWIALAGLVGGASLLLRKRPARASLAADRRREAA